MLQSWITENDFQNYEPQILDLLRTDEIDINHIIAAAKSELNKILIHEEGIDVKYICTPLVLTNDTKSVEDSAYRSRLVVKVTAVTNEPYFTLYGTDSSATAPTYTAIELTNQNHLIENIGVMPEIGTYTWTFDRMFKYYKITFSGTYTLDTNYPYLVECAFERPHLFLALSIAYKRLNSLNDDIYGNKADFYMTEFKDSLSKLHYSLDSDADADVDSEDTITSNMFTEIRL